MERVTGRLDWIRARSRAKIRNSVVAVRRARGGLSSRPKHRSHAEFVPRDLKEWLAWLRTWNSRLAFRLCQGLCGVFTGEYVEATRPFLSFGEFWDECSYRDGVLERNQDSHRQVRVRRVTPPAATRRRSDFTTKGILQEALARNEYWRLIDARGRPPGFCGMWPSRAVTFIENLTPVRRFNTGRSVG